MNMFQMRTSKGQVQLKNGGAQWMTPVVTTDGAKKLFTSQRKAAEELGVDEKQMSRWVNGAEGAKVRKATANEVRELLGDQVQDAGTVVPPRKSGKSSKPAKKTKKPAPVTYRIRDDGAVLVRLHRPGQAAGFFRAATNGKKIVSSTVAVKRVGGEYKTAVARLDDGKGGWRWATERDVKRAWPKAVRVFDSDDTETAAQAAAKTKATPTAAASAMWAVVWPDGLTTVRLPNMRDPILMATPVKEVPKEIFTKCLTIDMRPGE